MDYQRCITNLFSDGNKFQNVKKDATPARLKSLQRYLRTLCNRNEINDSDFKTMRPKNAKPARAHGLPKIHKTYNELPKFRPIIDTTGTTHYAVGKYLTNLLNPLTLNSYTLKDSFDAAERIRQIPNELFHNGYVFISFDVTSLFTNVPLKRIIDIIVNRVYNKKLIKTNLKKSSLRKLIKDTCTKTVFSANNELYEQTDGVSMGSSLGPVLANIIMTELEDIVIKPLINDNTIRFYSRYVDDTLLLLKPEDIQHVHNALNNFDAKLQFTVDTFELETPHFLDIEISPDGLSIFRKDTNTGLYTNYNSFTPWNYRKAWIRSLVNRATRICSPEKLKEEINTARKFASWNGFPRYITNSIIKYAQKPKQNKEEMDDPVIIWLRIPYAGSAGENLVSNLKRKLKHCFKKNINFKFNVTYSTHKIAFYTNMKDTTPQMYKSNIVYKFTCPGCNAAYIGKTERNLFQRCNEHATTKDSAIYNHMKECSELHYLNTLLTLNLDSFDSRDISIETVKNNTKVIDSSDNWSKLLIKEALYIKSEKPLLNNGLKASRDLYPF